MRAGVEAAITHNAQAYRSFSTARKLVAIETNRNALHANKPGPMLVVPDVAGHLLFFPLEVGASRVDGHNRGPQRHGPLEPRMAELKEARVPDIGDYSDVPVIELLVAVGDTVTKDQGLLTLESDKATLEVPAPFAGVVK